MPVPSTGLGLHFRWGEQRVGDFFIAPGPKRVFRVGRAGGVDFVLGDSMPLGSERFELMRSDGRAYTLRFTDRMTGSLLRRGETLDLRAVIESGKASHEGGAYALTLEDGDRLSVDLGGVTLEARREFVPERSWVPRSESLDLTALGIFLVFFFLASMFVLRAPGLAAAGSRHAQPFEDNPARLVRLILKLPATHENRFLAQLDAQRAARGDSPRRVRTSTSPSKPITLSKIIPLPTKREPCPPGRFFDPVREAAALKEIRALEAARQNERLPRNTRGFQFDELRVNGPITKESVWQVLRRNRGQLHSCHQRLLDRFPELGGNVVVRFIINAEGFVVTSSAARSTVNNPELESCVAFRTRTWPFPKSGSGGRTVVTYSFDFNPLEP